jgi:hypothetical protein
VAASFRRSRPRKPGLQAATWPPHAENHRAFARQSPTVSPGAPRMRLRNARFDAASKETTGDAQYVKTPADTNDELQARFWATIALGDQGATVLKNWTRWLRPASSPTFHSERTERNDAEQRSRRLRCLKHARDSSKASSTEALARPAFFCGYGAPETRPIIRDRKRQQPTEARQFRRPPCPSGFTSRNTQLKSKASRRLASSERRLLAKACQPSLTIPKTATKAQTQPSEEKAAN